MQPTSPPVSLLNFAGNPVKLSLSLPGFDLMLSPCLVLGDIYICSGVTTADIGIHHIVCAVANHANHLDGFADAKAFEKLDDWVTAHKSLRLHKQNDRTVSFQGIMPLGKPFNLIVVTQYNGRETFTVICTEKELPPDAP